MADRKTLTDAMVRAVKPAPAGKRIEIWDAVVPSLVLRTTDSGSKSWCVVQRVGAKVHRVTLGRYPTVGIAAARELAREALGDLVQGIVPAEAKRERERQAVTVAEFAERYMQDFAAAHKKPRSIAEDRRNLDLHILPELGNVKLADLDKAAVARFHATGRDRPINANRCLALLSHMLSMAERWGNRPDGSNPCRHIERYPEKARERFLTAAELSRLGEALSEAEGAGSEAVAALAAIRLLILTGARLSEVLTLRWDHVDMDRQIIRLPDSKTGAKTIPLGAPALEILAALPRHEGSPYVLPGRSDGHFVGLQHVWQRIRAAAGLGDLRLHDLRHSFASVAVAAGDSLFIVGKVLGHSQAATTQRYAHLAADPLLAVANKTAGKIDALMRQRPAAEIVPIKSPSRG